MARARNIKPGLLKNEILGVADPLYTLLFEGLWMLADREGRVEDRPLRIKAELFPYRDGLNVSDMLAWLQQNGFIKRYAVGSIAVIQILQFAKHQTPHGTERDSELPDENGMLTVHTRGKNGYATGEFSLVDSGLTVKTQVENTLIPDSLIPDSSVPKGTGASAPATDKPEDPIWDVGLQFLVAKGVKERGGRGFLGKMRQKLGDLVAAELLAKAQSLDVSDPVPWLRAAAERRLADGRSAGGVAL
jgi:hypothetical protein